MIDLLMGFILTSNQGKSMVEGGEGAAVGQGFGRADSKADAVDVEIHGAFDIVDSKQYVAKCYGTGLL
jgi:hypothetical protein